MASVFLYHVVGDLTVGKPELVEFSETETVESAIRAIGESTEGGIPIWRRRSQKALIENAESRRQRFVGILNSLDIVAFLARDWCLQDQEKALKTPVSEVVVPNNSLLKEVDPGTRLIDALEMMRQGVKRLLVPKSVVWKGMSKRFSILYYGKWLKNLEAYNNATSNANRPSSSSTTPVPAKFCCLSREDVIRFVIGCLGALAPLPLSSIYSLGVINPNFCSLDSSLPAIEVIKKLPQDPSAVAVVESTSDGQYKIIGDISAYKLWKCDYPGCRLGTSQSFCRTIRLWGLRITSHPEPCLNFSTVRDNNSAGVGPTRPRKFSSRNIGFFTNLESPSFGAGRSMYRGRSAPLTCKTTNSLAAVMAQMLSHRATHVWVAEAESEDILVGVVGYADILAAVTKHPSSIAPAIHDPPKTSEIHDPPKTSEIN
ncbi:LOW QUALITY PROTEIN: hypothetical protein RJ641_023326 [Dillenia turbinata]|uniref:CBS domain-containing protein n=1 Tax=Dillenia turbinata TaxID=194707 RepID=A0AAN8UIL3_9MAGN